MHVYGAHTYTNRWTHVINNERIDEHKYVYTHTNAHANAHTNAHINAHLNARICVRRTSYSVHRYIASLVHTYMT